MNSDNQKYFDDKIILSKNEALIKYSSRIIKRGLDLANRLQSIE